MRYLIIQVLAGLFFAQTSWALRQPKTAAELAELASIGGAMKQETDDFNAKLLGLQVALDRESSGIDKHPRVQELLDGQMSTLMIQHERAMTEIVRRTVALYDIQPGPNSGKLVSSEMKGFPVQWAPTYAEEAPSKEVYLNNGTKVILKAPGAGYLGITWADGSVAVNAHAFLSPGYLGAVLYHESIHFEQLTTKGRGDVQTAVMAELEAHSQSSSKNAERVFGLTSGEAKSIKSAMDRQMAYFQQNPSATMASMQFKGGEELLREKMAEAKREAATSRTKLEEDEARRRAERAKPIELVPEEPGPPLPVADKMLPPVPEADSSAVASESVIEATYVAQNACANPPKPFDRWLAMIAWPQLRSARDLRSKEAGLSECELRVYRRLADFSRSWQRGQRLSADDVRAAVVPPSTYRGTPSSSAPRTRNCWTDGEGNRVCEEQ